MKSTILLIVFCLLITGISAQQRAPSDKPPVGKSSTQDSPSRNPAVWVQSKIQNSIQSPLALYSHGDPTNDEQYILECVNRARANPTAEGIRLATTTDTRVTSAYTYWGIDLNKLKQQFAGYPVRPPMAFNAKLIVAARRHCNDMKAKNYQGHTGSDGSDPGKRISDAGYAAGGGWGENVAAYSESAWHAHCGLNVDWGTQNQIDLGHRHNIMNFAGSDPVYVEVGIGAIAGAGGGQVGPLIVAQDFSSPTSGDRFAVGVVYKDKNNNGFYDQGEGVSGVTITPSTGGNYTVSSTSGGYAVPARL